MEISVKGVEHVTRRVNVEVDPIEFLNSLKSTVCHVPSDAFVRDGKVVTAVDVSYHGSPSYEYKTYQILDEDLEIMNKIDELSNLIRDKIYKSYK